MECSVSEWYSMCRLMELMSRWLQYRSGSFTCTRAAKAEVAYVSTGSTPPTLAHELQRWLKCTTISDPPVKYLRK